MPIKPLDQGHLREILIAEDQLIADAILWLVVLLFIQSYLLLDGIHCSKDRPSEYLLNSQSDGIEDKI